MDLFGITLFGISITQEQCWLILALCLFYMSVVAPVLYRYRIVPEIERRYKTKIVATRPTFRGKYGESNLYSKTNFWRWGIENFEISLYIVSKFLKKFIKLELPMITNPKEGTYLFELKRIGYDINKASMMEILLSFLIFIIIGIFFIVLMAYAINIVNLKNNIYSPK